VIYKAGQSLASAVDETTFVVIRAPQGDVQLTCGGVDMVEGKSGVAGGTVDAAHQGETLLGKRYVEESVGLEVLCTKSGKAAVAVDGQPLTIKTAKPLPASD
jgi:hypothetical protein